MTATREADAITSPGCEPRDESAGQTNGQRNGVASERYPDEAAILATARQLGETVLGPKAQQTDQGPGPDREIFRALADAGLLGIALPHRFGGLDASGATQREYSEILASYCGVTAFTQAQHHGSSRMIANGPNEALKNRVVPDLAAGRSLCAISFAHLRRPGPPILRAESVADANGEKVGFRLHGTAPWVTGWGLMNQVVMGATLPDGRFVYVWSPARREEYPELFADAAPPNGDWGTLTASEPIRLAAMNASATVELKCDGWFVPQSHWLAESDRETLARNDRNGVLGATALPMGGAAGSVRLLCQTAEKRNLPAIRRAASAFREEWSELKEEIVEGSGRGSEPDFFERAVGLRSRCVTFASRAALAAVTASSGGAIPFAHPAQRLLREAMFYTVQAQTQEVMDATLSLIER